MPISLERMLTHPSLFGLTTATPVQRAICRAADGLPLGELALVPSVVRAFGGEDAVVALQSPYAQPKELFIVAAIRCGKSLITAALAARAALTCDLSALKKNEVPRVSVLSLTLDLAGVIMEHLMGALNKPVMATMVVGKPKSRSVRIRREDGRVVEIAIVAGRGAGGSLVSRWSAGVIFDEAPRMNGEDDGVVNFDESRRAVLGRLLPGAQLVAVGSPWAPRGPIYDAVQGSWGRPTPQLVVVRAIGPEMNPWQWTPENCEKLKLSDEAAYITDVLGEFADAEAGLFLSDDLKRATREAPVTLDRQEGWHYTAAMDPARTTNAWTLVIVGFQAGVNGERSTDRYHVARCRQWQGSKREPLKARAVLDEMALELRTYGLSEVHTDQWGAGFIAELGEDVNVSVVEDRDTTTEKDERWMDLRTKIVAGQVELSPDPVLRSDLLSARKRYTANGIKVDLPLTRDGRHADYAPALNLAVAKAASGPGWADLLTDWKSRGGATVY